MSTNQPGFIYPTEIHQTAGGHQIPVYVQQQPGTYPPSGPMPQGPPPAYQPGYPPHSHQQPPHQPFPNPINNQPSSAGAPLLQTQYSEFFHYMTGITSLHVYQKVELLEAVLGWETQNKYTVKDQAGNKIFYAGEISDVLSRLCITQKRGFTMDIKDPRGANVVTLERPMDCSLCCGLICPDVINVKMSNGHFLGSVTQNFSIFTPSLTIRNSLQQPVLYIEGPCMTMSICPGMSVRFEVKHMDGRAAGIISKEWAGGVREFFTDADNFSITLPIDLDPAVKVVCLAALFLIDYRYFERKS